MLESFSDFFVPLMRILDRLPNRAGQNRDILHFFEQTYRQQIVPHQYTKNQSGNIRWEHNVRWSREKLKLLGFIDAPRRGIWLLTEKGHLWLTEHPEATHLSAEKPKSQRKNRMAPPPPARKVVTNQMISGGEFLVALQQNLPGPLQPIIGSVFYEFVQRSNYLQIRLAGFSGCHYQIILRRGKHEIALHFESSAERSQARLRGFEPHLDALSQALKMPVHAGNFQSRGWTQVWIEKQAQPLSLDLANEFTNLISRFVAATYPILQIIYGSNVKIHKRSVDKENLTDTSFMYRILDQEVENIQSYLQGRSVLQPSDEKLCDWVNFCYTFAMYAEGKDLFSLVSGSEVHPWYYERTRKIARVCETKCNIK
jgi:hypothetical protein